MTEEKGMTTEKPILFSTPMVQAILEGRKTQTRRIIKSDLLATKDKYKVGQTLWVRETWNTLAEFVVKPDYRVMGKDEFVYKADNDRIDKWKPSIFMPKEACRLRLKITEVRVERLQDITWQDIEKEGIVVPAIEPLSPTHKELFESLWQKINGNWEENPFVWVLTFTRIY